MRCLTCHFCLLLQKSRSFDNLVKGEQSRRMEFDDETIDREVRRSYSLIRPSCLPELIVIMLPVGCRFSAFC